jgi:heterodisulfide reductase subunit C2
MAGVTGKLLEANVCRVSGRKFTVSRKRVNMTLTMNAGALSPESIRKLNELSGENVKVCMQCATCTGMCPMAAEMEFSPRKVMHLAQFGLQSKLKDINTYWKCASCHACTVKCPRGIDIARVMEALRQLSLRTGKNHIEPSEMSAETIAELPQIALVAGFRKLTS